MRKLINKKDIWLILAILSVSGGLLWYGKIHIPKQDLRAEVLVDDEIVMSIPLDHEHTGMVKVPGVDVELEIAEQAVRFAHSNCPDQICVHSGWLRRGGNVAACLPNQVVVRLISESDDESDQPDVVVGR